MADPILVSGAHRSGTTFVASALAAAPDVMFQQREPSNQAGYALGGLLPHGYAYAPDIGADAMRREWARVLSGRSPVGTRSQRVRCLLPGRPRLLVKDPLGSFSLEWVATNFAVDVVVMVRHPGAFAWSLKRMGWDLDFTALTRQPRLMEEHLSGFADALADPPHDLMSRAGLIWSCVNTALADQIDRHPEWHCRRHEDVSVRPLEELQQLYRALGLEWTDEARDAIAALTEGGEVEAPSGQAHALVRDSRRVTEVWRRRLEPAEIDAVRRWTEPVASRFYDESSWDADERSSR